MSASCGDDSSSTCVGFNAVYRIDGGHSLVLQLETGADAASAVVGMEPGITREAADVTEVIEWSV